MHLERGRVCLVNPTHPCTYLQRNTYKGTDPQKTAKAGFALLRKAQFTRRLLFHQPTSAPEVGTSRGTIGDAQQRVTPPKNMGQTNPKNQLDTHDPGETRGFQKFGDVLEKILGLTVIIAGSPVDS